MEKEAFKKQFTDPYTNESFIPKRTNQLFANRSNQIKFNNEKAKKIRKQKSETEKTLHKNLKTILNLLGDKKEITKSIEYLRGAEFDFSCFTHFVDHEGKAVRTVYGHKVIILENQTVKIIKHD